MPIAGLPHPGRCPREPLESIAKPPCARAVRPRPSKEGEHFQSFARFKVMHLWQRIGSRLALCVRRGFALSMMHGAPRCSNPESFFVWSSKSTLIFRHFRGFSGVHTLIITAVVKGCSSLFLQLKWTFTVITTVSFTLKRATLY